MALAAAPGIGPALPPGVVLPSSNYVQDEESDEEAGPSAHPAAPENADADDGAGKEADAGTQQEAGTADGETKRRAGPALPAGVDLEKIAAQAAKVDWQRVEEAEEEDEEDLVGPAMPGQVTLGFVKASIAAEERALANAIAEHERRLHGEKPAHEEWMTALPDVKALGFTLDQLQQTRTFQRKARPNPALPSSILRCAGVPCRALALARPACCSCTPAPSCACARAKAARGGSGWDGAAHAWALPHTRGRCRPRVGAARP